MKRYIGTKIIMAERFDKQIGNCISADPLAVPGIQEGYKVRYPDGYESWSPKAAFEEAYRLTDGMNFGLAMEAAKMGKKIEREGWNGKGMHLEAQFPDEHSKMTFPYLFMTIPDCQEGTRKLPWQPAQADLFSNDWRIVD